MSGKNIVCWKCGGKLPDYCFPVRHHDLCPTCREDLHACRMCRSFDPNVSGKCNKDEADYVSNKERANYCHYFKPRSNAHKPIADKSAAAKNELANLFGDSENAPQETDFKQQSKEAKEGLNELFGENNPDASDLSPEEKARLELEKLFGKNE